MWRINRICVGICLTVGLLLSGCGDDSGKTGPKGGGKTNINQPPPFKAVAPPFNADSAYAYIEKQLAFGPRVPNSAAHAACADWFVSEFKRHGAEVTVQTGTVTSWDKQNFALRNVIASYNPEHPRRIMVTAHWDSRPIADKDPVQPTSPVPAANDGGSGAAVILELARQFSMKAPEIGVDFILWDAEDAGTYENNESWCLGSQFWSKKRHKAGYRAMWGINLDMVGAKDATFIKDGFSMQYAQNETNKVWNIGHNLGYGRHFPISNPTPGAIDDHYFIMTKAGIPMVEVLDRNMTTGDFFPHWHKITDDIEQIDKATLQATGQTVLEVLLREK